MVGDIGRAGHGGLSGKLSPLRQDMAVWLAL